MNPKVKGQRSKVKSFASQSGQTFTEYTMILGLLTAIIIGLTAIIVPGLGQSVVGLVNYMILFLGSPNS